MLTIEYANNPRWSTADHSTVDLDVKFFEFESIIPFTAKNNDITEHGKTLYGKTIVGDFGEIAEYVAPPVLVPGVVTMRQARLALLQQGLLSTVQLAINSLPSPQKEAAEIEWDYSSEVHRSSQFVQLLGANLGLSSQQLDDLFTLAASL